MAKLSHTAPKQTRVQIIKDLENKAKNLSTSLGVKVEYFTITQNEKIYFAFFKEPNIIAAATCADMLAMGKVFEAGLKLWGACYMAEHSSPEIESVQKYKFSLLPKVGNMLDAVQVDVKKN